MTLPDLWNNLTPKEATLEKLKKDYERGITPDLPYFIVGQNDVKEKIGGYLEKIDEDYFHRSLIFSDYGNGKTNLLKYLELYFSELDNNENIHYIYQRANVDKPDIFLNLLKLIEDDLLSTLIDSMQSLDNKFIEEQASIHSNISDYIRKVSERSSATTEELILMGTDRYYTKNYYNKHEIPQLTNFDRREVFIFFMNVLSENNQYVIFALDELEKIYEKSKMRFRSFLTSYRELIDKSNEINGHFLVTAIVSSAANIDDVLLENPAFYSRIKKDMIEVGFLTTTSAKEELIKNISQLLDLTLSDIKISDIASELKREYGKGTIRSNRHLLVDIFNVLNAEASNPTFKALNAILEEYELEDEFKEMYEDLEDEGTFSKIETRFFDPLQYYLEYKGYEINSKKENNFFKKTNLFYPYKSNKVYSFIVNHHVDIDAEIDKLNELISNDKLVVAFTPENLDIQYENFESEDITIINYNPKKLLTLLVMFEEIGYQEEIEKIIYEYTRGEL
jgi:hypothetical protein